MAEPTLLDKVRFSLRQTISTNADLNAELQRYINAAVLNLTGTTDIRAFEAASADALLQDAIIAYAHWMFETDVDLKDAYKRMFDDLKTQISKSSVYSNLGGTS